MLRWFSDLHLSNVAVGCDSSLSKGCNEIISNVSVQMGYIEGSNVYWVILRVVGGSWGLFGAIEGCWCLFKGCWWVIEGCCWLFGVTEDCWGYWGLFGVIEVCWELLRVIEGCCCLFWVIEDCWGYWGLFGVIEGCWELWRVVGGYWGLLGAIEGCWVLLRVVGVFLRIVITLGLLRVVWGYWGLLHIFPYVHSLTVYKKISLKSTYNNLITPHLCGKLTLFESGFMRLFL